MLVTKAGTKRGVISLTKAIAKVAMNRFFQIKYFINFKEI